MHIATHTGTDRISFIGMSEVGKSYWSTQFAEQLGYEYICCDDVIAEQLKPTLQEAGFTVDTADVTDVAAWMGMPFEERSVKCQLAYLNQEEGVLRNALAHCSTSERIVVDTTGSDIYLSEQVLTLLCETTVVVYLETPPDAQQKMLQQFMEHPKPVIWGDVYAPNPDEDPTAAVRRCYPQLLETRAARYAKLAHVTVPWEAHRSSLPLTAQELLDGIKLRIPAAAH